MKARTRRSRRYRRAVTSPIDHRVAQRLAFIRYLHNEARTQAQRPEPFSFATILSCQDAIELFYGLVADQFHPTLAGNTSFEKYPTELNKALAPLGKSIVTGRNIDRLNKTRVLLKHYNGTPSQNNIDDAVIDTTTFLTQNVKGIFDIDYDAVTMADVMPQPLIAAKVKAASATHQAGDTPEAMALLVESFQDVFEYPKINNYMYGRPALQFGGEIHYPIEEREIQRFLYAVSKDDHRYANRAEEKIAELVGHLTKVAKESQIALRLLVSGIEYASYLRFQRLTPGVEWTPDEPRRRYFPKNYAPTEDDFAFCENFIITAAVKLAGVDADLAV